MIKRTDGLVFHGELNDRMNIIWDLTKYCNFDCSYCYPKTKNITLISNLNLLRVVDFILNLEFNNYNIIITGGEATLHPKLMETIKYLIEQSSIKNKNVSISLFSNMCKSVEFYEYYFNLTINHPGVEVLLFPSFHSEFISIHNFLDKLKYLQAKNYKLIPFSFMIHNDECINLLNSVKDDLLKISFIISPIYEMKMDYKKVDKSLKSTWLPKIKYSIYYKNGEYSYDLGGLNNNEFRGFMCSSFKQQLVIQPNGLIKPCELFDYKKILHVYNEESLSYIKENEYVICPVKNCTCGKKIPKFNYKHFKTLNNINEDYILKNIKKENDESGNIL